MGALDDPFLKSLNARVVAKAQRALRARDMRIAKKAHISEARKPIKAALLDADDTAQHSVSEYKIEAHQAAIKAAQKKKEQVESDFEYDDSEGAAVPDKKFSWKELQAGADAPEEEKKPKADIKVVGKLMSNLKAAPGAEEEMQHDQLLSAKKSEAQASILTDALSSAKEEAGLVSDDDDDDDDTDGGADEVVPEDDETSSSESDDEAESDNEASDDDSDDEASDDDDSEDDSDDDADDEAEDTAMTQSASDDGDSDDTAEDADDYKEDDDDYKEDDDDYEEEDDW